MHKLCMIMAVAPLALLPACGGAVQQTASTAPTVSYTYDDDDDYEMIAKRADLHCEEQYHRDAVLVDRDVEGSGYEATFRCE